MTSSESDLWSLTYTSAAVRLPTRTELEGLLARARVRNLRESVTGVLLYQNGSFLQCIEGPEAGVGRVYAAISADRLHHNISELVREPITRREYREWSMALCFISGDLRSSGDDLLLSRLSRTDEDASASRRLVSAFWGSGMDVKCSRAYSLSEGR